MAYEQAVRTAVSEFGRAVKPKLRGAGWPEDQLRGPLENLFGSVAAALGLTITMTGEVPLVDIDARPDYAVTVAGALVGHVELKRPGIGADPTSFSGRNTAQWEKLRLLPNVLYADGNEWGLYRNGNRVGDLAYVTGSVKTAGGRLAPQDSGLARVLHDFLTWQPQPPRTVHQLVRAVAGLCQLLREEVQQALNLEKSGQRTEMFTVLAEDWRRLLFPEANDEEFADQYAQTVVFALLLARVEGIVFDGDSMHGIATKLGKKHSLMGKALGVLTDESLGGLSTTLHTLLRVIGPVNWSLLDDGSGDAYLRLYEDFLQVYDPKLRERTGSYYTPNGVVASMTQLTEAILKKRLGITAGFASPDVVVVDPAMGAGTFLLSVLERAAAVIEEDEGSGAVGPRLREMVGNRLVGFEIQTGPYAVAELRMHATLKEHRSAAPSSGLRLYVADTLENPKDDFGWLPHTYASIAESRKQANSVKRNERVMVVIGNPPYDEVKKGAGKWVESGDPSAGESAPMEAFKAPGNGKYESKLSNLYAYFWRWATWKVFDHHEDSPFGVVAFITPSAWLKGQAFAGMRDYLRRVADEGWIIDVSPEQHWPDNSTRLFPGVGQQLCIAIFVRWSRDRESPALVKHLQVNGRRDEKIGRLSGLTLDDPDWRTCMDGWQDPFLPPRSDVWRSSPALADLMPWSSRGVTPGRVWVYAPDRKTLADRWRLFLAADTETRRTMFGEARDRNLDKIVDPLPGIPDHGDTPLKDENRPYIEPIRVGYRSFDRQWIIPDNRLMVVARPDLWRVRSERQVFTVEQNAKAITGGPGLVFTALIPDMNYYDGRAGCARPLFRDAASVIPNISPGLLEELNRRLGCIVSAEDLVAYIAAITSHPAYTSRFREDLEVPGARVPLTLDAVLWKRSVELGRRIIWLHTYGERFFDPSSGRPKGAPKLPPSERPRCVEEIPDAVGAMPEALDYDEDTASLLIGSGCVSPVPLAVRNYAVSGMNVIDKWFGYRRKDPAGKRRLVLDFEVSTSWLPEWTTELLELLNVLGLLVREEGNQEGLLNDICDSDLLTVDMLQHAGVLPVPASSKRALKQKGPGLLF
ncbi:type ISP restriction/modification enzyme [Streptomyces sp. NPDC007162]|uniref:type ISP restriction/modification enzyme n=1 Tax=Streptomyces sp. NPDC007162 TaxID=3156917 RepID=UPI0033EBC099